MSIQVLLRHTLLLLAAFLLHWVVLVAHPTNATLYPDDNCVSVGYTVNSATVAEEPAGSIEECETLCSAHPSCRVADFGYGICWMKEFYGTPSVNHETDIVYQKSKCGETAYVGTAHPILGKSQFCVK